MFAMASALLRKAWPRLIKSCARCSTGLLRQARNPVVARASAACNAESDSKGYWPICSPVVGLIEMAWVRLDTWVMAPSC
ncbi:hypothetical protein D3C78_1387900 [compost metagenome]